ncbi:hypothetical protein SAMN05518865_112122 [Duganella sp. CF458]|uniref:DUF6916 family protein n=1 Tax=Duganella sp. CF458 TaxID=1884368 RepID=UPI0008F09EE5|nr:hypothetical protein [Duganella sp. CF458]SFG45302.1 hypothetical protein SAMN05518865_112122 [Duganella sp. CF458]
MNDRVTSRRTLLKAGGGSLLAGLGLRAPAALASENGNSFGWSRAAAELLVGQVFWLNHPEHRALQIKLERVQASKIAPDGAQVTQFTVVFSAAAQPAILAGSYEIENEATGRQLVFLQPGVRQGALVTLRADFNLHV